jgi:hypothetical protein
MNHFNLIQGSEDWQNVRIGRFTASTVHNIIYSKKPTKTFETHVFEKVTETIYKQPTFVYENQAMQWGSDHEVVALIEYQKKNSVFCQSVGFVPLGDDAGCSPDKLVGEKGGIEVKCPHTQINHIKHCTIRSANDLLNIKKDYYWQIQMCLLCTDRAWWDFVSFDPRLPKEHPLRLFQFRLWREQEPLERLRECLRVAVERKKELLKLLTK